MISSRLAAVLGIVVVWATTSGSAAAQGDGVTLQPLRGPLSIIVGAIDNIVVSSGPDGLLLVDVGYPETVDGVRAALAMLSPGSPPPLVINTHWHHSFANADLAPSATIVAQARAAERTRRRNFMFNRWVMPQAPAGWPTVTFEDSLTIHFNGERIELLHLACAHTDGDVAVFFTGSNVVATGDVFVPHVPWVDRATGGDFRCLLAAVDTLLSRVPRDAILVPGHDRVSSYEDLRGFRGLLHSVAQRVRDGIALGWSIERIQDEGLAPEWRSWETMIPARVLLADAYAALAPPPETPALELRGGRWFDGERFLPRTVYVVAGRLEDARPATIDSVIDLAGGYVVGPYGEAHTHRFGSLASLDDDIGAFLSDGVFYAMIQDPIDEITDLHQARFGRGDSPDVVYTQAVITPSWGVIPDLYRSLLGGGRFPWASRFADLDTRVVTIADDSADVAEKWPALRDRNPHFVKIVLAFSDEVERRRGNSDYGAILGEFSAKPGLAADLVPMVATLAHGDGLRLSAHIETAADFRAAVTGGADLIAHLPGSWQVGEGAGFPAADLGPWLLTPDDARLAAEADVAVITTVASGISNARAEEVHRHNLELLSAAGVRILIGSDGAGGGAVGEALVLDSLDLLPRAAILSSLTMETPRAILPTRRVGRLERGHEASFLVLGGDPLADMTALRDIRLAVKAGVVVGGPPR